MIQKVQKIFKLITKFKLISNKIKNNKIMTMMNNKVIKMMHINNNYSNKIKNNYKIVWKNKTK